MSDTNGRLPATWRSVALGEVLERIEAGTSFKAQDRPAANGEVGVLKLSAVTWNTFRPGENKALLPGCDPGDCPRVRKGDLLISRANTTELIAAVVMVQEDHPNLILSDKTLRLVPKKEVCPHYLLHVLRIPSVRRHFERHATGTSGSMRNISQENITAAKIPLPPLSEQRRLGGILDKANAIRCKREEGVRLTEDLLRSTFLEMFGDPARNPKGWPIRVMGDVVRETQYGTAEKSNSDGTGIPVLRMNNITYGGQFDLADLKWCKIADADLEQLTVKRGDLLFNRTNSPELVGKTAVWDRDESYAYAGYLFRVRFDENVVLPDYVSAFLNSAYGKKMLFAKAKPSNNMSNFSAGEFCRIELPVPDINLQRRFKAVVDDVTDMKEKRVAGLAEATTLFGSLVQRAFSGELTNGEKA